MDQTKDTATSFRWFTIEAEMEKMKTHAQPCDSKVSHAENAESYSQSKIANGVKRNKKDRSGSRSNGREGSTAITQTADDEAVGASEIRQDSGPKGKRKVTFDVNTDLVTAKKEVDVEKKQEVGMTKRDGGGMWYRICDIRLTSISSRYGVPSRGRRQRRSCHGIIR
jgi:hypothetical protein